MAATVEKVEWGGWPNCYRVSNGEVELIVTSDVGPRIMRYGYVGGANLFLERDGESGGIGEVGFVLRGGHRLWHAPEDAVRTYAPDNTSAEAEIHGGTVTVAAPAAAGAGIRKQMMVRMAQVGSAVTVVHTLENTLPWSVELAPWAISMMAKGGVGITGFPPKGSHANNLSPSTPLAMWAYTDLADPRLTLTSKHIVLRQDAARGESNKLGLFHPKTWGAYLVDGTLFLKRSVAEEGKVYPDFGCSFEVYVDGSVLELETLGPLTRLAPGARVDHVERWTLTRDVAIDAWNDAEIDRVMTPLL